MDNSPIRQETSSSGQTVPIKGHYWATPTNRELQNAPRWCEEVWSYNSVRPQLTRPPQCIRGAVRSALIGQQAEYCPLIGCQGQASWLQLSSITRWCPERALARPLYIYSVSDRETGKIDVDCETGPRSLQSHPGRKWHVRQFVITTPANQRPVCTAIDQWEARIVGHLTNEKAVLQCQQCKWLVFADRSWTTMNGQWVFRCVFVICDWQQLGEDRDLQKQMISLLSKTLWNYSCSCVINDWDCCTKFICD